MPRTGRTVVRDVPVPPCPPGSVLVQNAFSAISSGTERARVELSQKSLVGKARARPDLVREVLTRARREGVRATLQAVQYRLGEETSVGYSSAGTVVEVGEHVRGLQHGDLVACAGAGARHAEFVAVPANLCVRTPPGVPLTSAAITTIAAIAMHGVRLADVRLGSRVAVIGCGLVGQIALRLLRAAGAETLALDIDPQRVRQASSGGADHALTIERSTAEQVRNLTASVGVDEVVVAAAASTNDPLLLAAEIARDRGSIVLVGAVPIEFPRAPLYEKEVRFRVSRSYGAGRYDPEYEERGLDYPIGYVRWTEKRNMEAVLRLQAHGLLSLSDLVEVMPVEQAALAYDRLTGGRQAHPQGAIVLSYGVTSGSVTHGSPEAGAVKQDIPMNGATVSRAPIAGGARRTPTSATSPIRVGLIGPGAFASRVLIPALQEAGAKLVVVGGGSGPAASAAARTGQFDRTAPDESAVIADPDAQAIVISTRHSSHAKLVVEALAAGRHVLCEKPLALTSDERDAVMGAATAASGTLLVGFNRRFSPLLREMRSFLASPGTPMTVNYRVSAGKLPEQHWIHDLAQGGGRALGEVCHFVDSVSFLVGSPIVEVHVNGHGAESRPVQAYDNLIVTLRFADAAIASVLYVADGSSGVAKERIEAFCGPRTAILDDYVGLELFDAGRFRKRRLRTQDKGHREEVVQFLEAARTGQPAVPLAQIDNTTLATLAIVESLRTGHSVGLIS
ncbi:MAG: bi-domain-containing oxidoreductase [Solirubrobacterales bacterium]|nr:bi-domain-containing oxidoreductase [Solirubrobacterales bacterium]